MVVVGGCGLCGLWTIQHAKKNKRTRTFHALDTLKILRRLTTSMAYQNQGYQNVPGSEESGHGDVGSNADPSMTNPGNDQQSYHLSSYHEYMQNNVYSHVPSNVQNFGDYGPNVGSATWQHQNERTTRNRTTIAIAVALFILFVIVHPAGIRENSKDTQNAAHASPHYNPSNYYPSHTGTHASSGTSNYHSHTPATSGTSSVPNSNTAENGIAGNGNENNKGTKPSPTNSGITSSTETVVDTNNASSELDIAYLLTYPMSGTTYTMLLASMTQNRSLATN